MKKKERIVSYTSEELEALKSKDRSDWDAMRAMTEEELEAAIASDEDERDIEWDWTKAKLVMPKARQSVHLRLEREVVEFFKSQGKGHISRMQAVLKAYKDAHTT